MQRYRIKHEEIKTTTTWVWATSREEAWAKVCSPMIHSGSNLSAPTSRNLLSITEVEDGDYSTADTKE